MLYWNMKEKNIVLKLRKLSNHESVELKTTIIDLTNVNETNDDPQMTSEGIKLDEEDSSNQALR